MIETGVDGYIADTDKLLDEIAALPKGQRTFDNTARRMAFHDQAADKGIEPGLFLQYVSQDEGVRNASVDADKKLQVSIVWTPSSAPAFLANRDVLAHLAICGRPLNPCPPHLCSR
jgi:hypothetical protein